MTDFLVKRFIKNSTDVNDPAVRTAYGNLAGAVGIFCNVLLCAAKLAVGTLFGSISITADAVNNLSDASSSVITLVGFRLSAKPADEHPYGHARIEYLAGLAVSVMILVIGVELARSSIGKILSPTAVEFSLVTVAVLLLSIGVKLWMAAFNKKVGRRIGSAALEATAMDSRNDVISTAAVLAASVVSGLTGLELDGWMGLGVALFILWSGVGILKETVDPLLGEAPSEELTDYIGKKVMSYDGVLGTHDLMVHDYGPGRRFASVHVEMAAENDVMQSHDIIDNIERDFQENDHISLIIHYDPILTGDDAVGTAREWVKELVRSISPELSIHDFRMVQGPSHTNLIFRALWRRTTRAKRNITPWSPSTTATRPSPARAKQTERNEPPAFWGGQRIRKGKGKNMEFKISDKMRNMKPSVIREILKQMSDPTLISFAGGNPAADSFPAEDIARFSDELLRQDPVAALQYSVSEGVPSVREAVRAFANRRERVAKENDGVLITSGSQQILDFAAKCLCNEGDVVAVENPAFLGAFNAFRSSGARLAGVPMEDDGVNLAALEAVFAAPEKPRFFYCIPNFQNPTGKTMSLAKRRAVYALAVRYGVPVLEDDPYGELRIAGEPVPSIKSMDTEGAVIYAGSFSKILCPGMRLAYCVCDKKLMAAFVVAKQCSDVHTNVWAQRVCEAMLTRTDMDAHIREIRKIYAAKAALMMEQLDEKCPQVRYTRPVRLYGV